MMHIRKRKTLAFAAAALAIGVLGALPALAAEPVPPPMKTAQYTATTPSNQPMARKDKNGASGSSSTQSANCPYRKDSSGQWIKTNGSSVSSDELRGTNCSNSGANSATMHSPGSTSNSGNNPAGNPDNNNVR